MKKTLLFSFTLAALTCSLQAQNVLIDFGSDATFRSITAPSPDANGNHWNSTAFGFLPDLVDTTGTATTIDWAPDVLEGIDSYNGPAGVTDNPISAADLADATAALDLNSLGDFGVVEAAVDFYVSNDPDAGVGRFQLQQVTPGTLYDLSFFASRKFMPDVETRFSVFDDPEYSNLLASVILNHGSGNDHNTDTVATIAGLPGPANDNNIFYIQWEGATASTSGVINAMSISVVPEPTTFALFAGMLLLAFVCYRRTR